MIKIRKKTIIKGNTLLLKAPRSTPQHKYTIDYPLDILGRQSSRSCSSACLICHHGISMTFLDPTGATCPHPSSHGQVETQLASNGISSPKQAKSVCLCVLKYRTKIVSLSAVLHW